MDMSVNADSPRTGTLVVDLLLVSFNSAHLLERLRDSLGAAARPGLKLRLLAVDNASSDGSGEILRATFPCDLFIQNQVNVGFGRANNQLLPHARGNYVLLLNTDAFVSPDTLRQSIAYMERDPRCGVLGVRLTDSDGSLQPSCRYFPTPLNLFLQRAGVKWLFPWVRQVDDMEWDHASVRECDWVPGCYYLTRRAVIEQIGLFDPRYFLYYEEVDHCRRVKAAGWRVVFIPDTSVVHLGGESAKSVTTLTTQARQISVLQIESELLYLRAHHGRAGLALHLLLVPVADSILAMKDLLRGRGVRAATREFRHTLLTWKACRRTRWATHPTR